MNIHENARTTPASRALLVRRVMHEGWSPRQSAAALGAPGVLRVHQGRLMLVFRI